MKAWMFGLLSALTAIILMPVVCASPEEPAKRDMPSFSSGPASETNLNNRGVQEAQAGRFDQGASLLRQAAAQDPSDSLVRKNLSGVLMDWARQLAQQGKVDLAIQRLQEAIQDDPANAQAMVRLGNLYFVTQDDYARAIEWWKRAYGSVPPTQQQALTQAIAQAERDRAIEQTFTGLKTTHFRIRFERPEQTPQTTRLGEMLEQAYARLASVMDTAPTNLVVLVYTNEHFQRVAGRRDWTLGLYDGRIRLRLDDLGTEYTHDILAHELAHAFLAESFGPGIPTWFHEGFAQLQEPSHTLTEHQQTVLDAVKAGTAWVPVKWLDHRFEQPSNLEDVERAYMQARLVVDFLAKRYGLRRVIAFAKQLASGEPIERAFEQTFAPLRWSRLDQGIPDE